MKLRQVSVWVVLVCLFSGLGTKAQQAGSTSGSNAGLSGATVSQDAGTSASGSVPRLINFSGVIKDAAGNVKTGTVTLTFSLYELQDGGSPLWAETQTVELDAQGRYAVLLGSTHSEGLPLDLFTTGQARWLAVQPALPGVGEQPRILLVGVPYALKAADADTLAGKPASAFVLADTQATSSSSGELPAGTAIIPPAAGNNATTGTSSVGGGGTTKYIPIWTSSTNLGNSLLYQTGGNVGIGTTNPRHLLDVGVVGATYSAFAGMFGGAVASSSQSGDPNQTAYIFATQSSATFGLNAYNYTTQAALPISIGWSGQNIYLAKAGGNVGIGTTSPSARLDLVGSLKVEGSGNGITFPDGTTQTSAAPSHTIAVCQNGSPSLPPCPHGYEAGPVEGPCTVTSDTGSCSGLQNTTGPWGCAVCKP